MSISNKEEVKCSCGYVFEAELISAISVADNPELKEALIAGEINLVTCPHCGQMFYAESFLLYHDSSSELIAFVYPLSFQNQAAQCRKKMLADFDLALKSNENHKINYEPLLIFGVEDLTLLLKNEQEIEDEEMVLSYAAPKIHVETLKISPSAARKFSVPKVFPVVKGEKNPDLKAIVTALKILTKHNPNLLHYLSLLDRLSKNKMLFEDIKKKAK